MGMNKKSPREVIYTAGDRREILDLEAIAFNPAMMHLIDTLLMKEPDMTNEQREERDRIVTEFQTNLKTTMDERSMILTMYMLFVSVPGLYDQLRALKATNKAISKEAEKDEDLQSRGFTVSRMGQDGCLRLAIHLERHVLVAERLMKVGENEIVLEILRMDETLEEKFLSGIAATTALLSIKKVSKQLIDES